MKNTIAWDGKQITKPGVYSGIPIDRYHEQITDGWSVSSSNLRRVLEENGGSPAHFWHEWSANPNRGEPAEREHFVFGRAVHHWLLGEAHFNREFTVRPKQVKDKHGIATEWQGNKTVCRDWLAQAAAGGAVWHERRMVWIEDKDQPPLTVLTQEEMLALVGMTERLRKNEYIRGGLLNGAIERSFFWKDRRTGLWIKSRPDAVPTDSGVFGDIKTTTSVQYTDLIRAISTYAYHQQAALIAEGAQVCAGIARKDFAFYFVFLEKVAPYCERVMQLGDAALSLGATQNRRALDIIATCLKREQWPGPGGGACTEIELSDWYAKEAKLNCDVYKPEGEAA